jgi:hypothetical protein
MNSFENRVQGYVLALVAKHVPHDRDGFVEAMINLFGRETKRSYVNGLKARSKPGQKAGRIARSYNSAVKNGVMKPIRRDAKEKGAVAA